MYKCKSGDGGANLFLGEEAEMIFLVVSLKKVEGGDSEPFSVV